MCRGNRWILRMSLLRGWDCYCEGKIGFGLDGTSQACQTVVLTFFVLLLGRIATAGEKNCPGQGKTLSPHSPALTAEFYPSRGVLQPVPGGILFDGASRGCLVASPGRSLPSINIRRMSARGKCHFPHHAALSSFPPRYRPIN
jgi:hypothetical protein